MCLLAYAPTHLPNSLRALLHLGGGMSRPLQSPVILTSASSSRRRLRLRGLRGHRGSRSSASEPSLPSLDETQSDGEIDVASDKIFGKYAQDKYCSSGRGSGSGSTASSTCSSGRTNSTSSSLFSQDDDVTSSIRTVEDLILLKKSCMRIRTQVDSLAVVYRSSTSAGAPLGTTAELVDSFDSTGKQDDAAPKVDDATAQSMQGSVCRASIVSFSQITVHRHLITLGDNPSPSEGPPISIEWTSFDSHTLTVDEYESAKPEPRVHQQLLIPRILREGWLVSNGVSRRAIQAAEKEGQRIQQRRWADATTYFVETNPQAAAYFKQQQQANNSMKPHKLFLQSARKLFPGWH